MRYVAQALIEAAFPARILALNGFSELISVSDALIAAQPVIVGLSMSDNQVATVQLALVALLRARGYRGVIVAGGALATVARHELLSKHSGLDAVVRREGEVPIVALARALRDGRSVEHVPGITTRTGDGPAFVEGDVVPVARPLRPELPKLLGMRVARVMASRGCSGGCAYCGSTALRRDAVVEARRAGMSLDVIRELQLGSQRQRRLADFADEIAELYHQRDVRLFRLTDDHILGPDAKTALAWLESLEHELRQRQVRRAAFTLMVEPSVVNDEVADAMQRLGVVRVLVGVEALTPEGLRALGREPRWIEMNRAVIHALKHRGMAVFHNSIFLHPESTPESMRAELEGLPFVPGVPFDALPLLVFPGTSLYSNLQRQGKLLGGMLGCDYTIDHPVTSLMRSLMHGLSHELPELAALSYQAFEVTFLQALSRRLLERSLSVAQGRASAEVVDRIGALRVDVLTRLLQIAEVAVNSGDQVKRLKDLVCATRPRIRALSQELAIHGRSVEGRACVSVGGVRTFASAMMTAGFVAVGPGCGGAIEDHTLAVTEPAATGGDRGIDGAGGSGAEHVVKTTPGDGGAESTLGDNSHGGGKSLPIKKTAALGGASARTLSIASTSSLGGRSGVASVVPFGGAAGNGIAGGSSGVEPYLSPECNYLTKDAISERLDSITRADCDYPLNCGGSVELRLNESGKIVDLVWISSYDYQREAMEAARACVIEALGQERYPCLTDGFVWNHGLCLLW